jgi:beta-aspartyl-peptidase (threonine type)
MTCTKRCHPAFLLFLSFIIPFMAKAQPPAKGNYVLVIHGGAGTILKKNMSAEKEALYRAGLQKALEAGYAKIKSGASGLDAVIAAITVLEDDSLFNAGKGAVFTHDGRNEMDAAIMDGKTLGAGSVAGVSRIKNPIL